MARTLVLLVAAIGLALGACGGDDDPSAAGSDTTVDENEGDTQGGGSAEVDSSCEDEEGDLANDKGTPVTPPATSPGTDLTAVRLTTDDTNFTITFQAANDLPQSGDAVPTERELRWQVNISGADDTFIRVETIFTDGEYRSRASVQGGPDGPQTIELDGADAEGDELVVEAALEELTLPDEFEWHAFTEWYTDANRLDDTCDDEGDPVQVS